MIECDHTFAEEREPSGRLIITPCLSCGMSAMDAMSALKAELSAAREKITEIYQDIEQYRVSMGMTGRIAIDRLKAAAGRGEGER